jgi:hypothetical protein
MVDMRIALLTLKVLFRRNGASDHAVAKLRGPCPDPTNRNRYFRFLAHDSDSSPHGTRQDPPPRTGITFQRFGRGSSPVRLDKRIGKTQWLTPLP